MKTWRSQQLVNIAIERVNAPMIFFALATLVIICRLQELVPSRHLMATEDLSTIKYRS